MRICDYSVYTRHKCHRGSALCRWLSMQQVTQRFTFHFPGQCEWMIRNSFLFVSLSLVFLSLRKSWIIVIRRVRWLLWICDLLSSKAKHLILINCISYCSLIHYYQFRFDALYTDTHTEREREKETQVELYCTVRVVTPEQLSDGIIKGETVGVCQFIVKLTIGIARVVLQLPVVYRVCVCCLYNREENIYYFFCLSFESYYAWHSLFDTLLSFIRIVLSYFSLVFVGNHLLY